MTRQPDPQTEIHTRQVRVVDAKDDCEMVGQRVQQLRITSCPSVKMSATV